MSNTTRQVVINDPKSLSGKHAVSIVKLAKSFSGDVKASVGSRHVSAKSLGQFLSLSLQEGEALTFSAIKESGSVLDQMVGVLIENKIGRWGTKPALSRKSVNEKADSQSTTDDSELVKGIIVKRTSARASKTRGIGARSSIIKGKVARGSSARSSSTRSSSMRGVSTKRTSASLSHRVRMKDIRDKSLSTKKSNNKESSVKEINTNKNTNKNKISIVKKLLSQKQVLDTVALDKVTLEKSVIILLKKGMHGRPATKLVKLAKGFVGKLEVANSGKKFVMASSLSQLLSINIKYGDTLFIRAISDGRESAETTQAYLDKVVAEIEKGLGDEILPVESPTEPVTIPAIMAKANKQPELKELSEQNIDTALNTPVDWSSFDTIPNLTTDVPNDSNAVGIPASAGMAIAPAYVKKIPSLSYDDLSNISVDEEKQKLTQAIEQAKADIAKLIEQTELDEIKGIFTSHLEILDDPAILEEVELTFNTEKLSAPAGWYKVVEQTAKEQECLTDTLLAQRATDFRDVGERVMAILCGVKTAEEPTTPYILVMDKVAPSDVAGLDPKRVVGILTAVGGASAHSAIVARALGIPAIVGAGSHTLEVANDTILIIDGETGEFIISPDNNQVERAKAEIAEQLALKTEAKKHAHETANTLDGHHLEIAANIGNSHETIDAVHNGAEAIGLFRTELVFMKETEVPNEATQTEVYRQVFKDLDGRSLVVRTLDVGGDKPLPYIPIPHEENPFLGMRGVRLSLRKPELLRNQVIALLKAADNKHQLRIMFPMVGRIEEWRFAKGIVDEVLKTYPCDDLQVGIMIEVPSAALLTHVFAREVDFFSIGTNDLTQYTMAIDRGHPVLSADASGLHPSVLGLIDLTVHNAHKHGKWVGVCGELAADATAVPILVGLGVDELSMSATSIPLVKAQIRKLNYSDCKILAKRALSAESTKMVRALVKHQQLTQLAKTTQNMKDSKETNNKKDA